ncbi:protein-L-isoaspartate O-methyltransferase family protein [Pengzhenrongella sicca]|uniref:Protein-L-isoaspartate O-methyltransferase n=1 Tax=Pengzhenrongella sicca TaxID=2819238 RepID=A0A8A4ZCQ8_9MICO|nr:methyltransferase domain-containing protein [Pengzhenrongella sicca]QTE29770.1 methyltransferase domain-containing protein [Pengzhenrongella sicca]
MTDLERAAEIRAAMADLDRRAFLPAEQRAFAAEDRPLPLGLGQTNSQPSTVAAMLRLLRVPAGARVLDVGAGSGWTTALLARLVGPTGTVLGLELEPSLARQGARNLAAWSMPWARLEVADPRRLGRPDARGFDRILVSAAARRLPPELVDQVAAGGRMVLPVRRTLWLVERGDDGVTRTPHGSYRFVPLR